MSSDKVRPLTVQVDLNKCQGHGRCALSSPEIFELDENQFSVVLLPIVTGPLVQKARTASQNCPEAAITIE